MRPAHVIRISIVASVLALVTTLAEAEPIAKTFAAASVRKLRVVQAEGRLSLAATESAQTTVKARKLAYDPGCELDVSLVGGELRVLATAPEKGVKAHCELALELSIPRGLPVSLELASVDLELSGLSGDLDYRVGRGDVTATDVAFGKLSGRSGSGNVAVRGKARECELKIGAGGAELIFTELPDRGHLELKLGSGNAVVKVPRDAQLKSSFKAGLGSMTNEVGDAAEANFTISGSAGTGDLTIRRL